MNSGACPKDGQGFSDEWYRAQELVRQAEEWAYQQVLEQLGPDERRLAHELEKGGEPKASQIKAAVRIHLAAQKLRDAKLKSTLKYSELTDKERLIIRAEIGSAGRALGPHGPGCCLPAVATPIVFLLFRWLGWGTIASIVVTAAAAIVLLAVSVWWARR